MGAAGTGRHTHTADDVGTWGGDGRLPAGERGLGQRPPCRQPGLGCGASGALRRSISAVWATRGLPLLHPLFRETRPKANPGRWPLETESFNGRFGNGKKPVRWGALNRQVWGRLFLGWERPGQFLVWNHPEAPPARQMRMDAPKTPLQPPSPAHSRQLEPISPCPPHRKRWGGRGLHGNATGEVAGVTPCASASPSEEKAYLPRVA